MKAVPVKFNDPINNEPGMRYGHGVTTRNWRVFKKIGTRETQSRRAIAALLIPKGTKVYITEGKCRAAKAKVLSMTGQRKRKRIKKGCSIHLSTFIYRKGRTVTPIWGFSMFEETCVAGIHFFRSRTEAVRFQY